MKMKQNYLLITTFVVLVSYLFLFGCAGTTVENLNTTSTTDIGTAIDSCTIDSDCICGGVDKNTGKCFLGNKLYYDKYVDKKKNCPDFCSGIAGNLVVKCIANKCTQMLGCLDDNECTAGKKCSNNKCVVLNSQDLQADKKEPAKIIVSPVTNPKQKPGSGVQKTESSTECTSNSDCKTAGCSGTVCQLASSPPTLTTCQYLPKFDCYKDISCACTAGKCAWQKTDKFNSCVESKQI